MESIVESRSQIFSVAGNLFIVFGVYRMVAEGTRSNQKLLALREKGVYSSYTYTGADGVFSNFADTFSDTALGVSYQIGKDIGI
jgi:hypothetical protein